MSDSTLIMQQENQQVNELKLMLEEQQQNDPIKPADLPGQY